MFILLIGLAHAECLKESRVVDLNSAVANAHLEFAMMEVEGFDAQVHDARQSILCLVEPLTPVEAASFHGIQGLTGYLAEDEDAAVKSFTAAISAFPTFRLPNAIAPAGGPIDTLIESARSLPKGEVDVLPPYNGTILIDGAPGFVRPVDRPFILQLIQDKSVMHTYILEPGEKLPYWEPPPTPLQRLIPRVRKQPSTPLAIAASGTAAAAGTAYILGGIWHEQYLDPETPYENLPALETQTNAALGTSIALGVAAAALTTVTFLRW